MNALTKLPSLKKVTGLGRFVPNAITRQVGRQILVTQKHSPKILFVAGVVGVGATVVMSCRATLKLEHVLEDCEHDIARAKEVLAMNRPDYTSKQYNSDMLHLYVRSALRVTKLYGPSIIVGVASVCSLAGAHNILTNRNVALTAAYTAVDSAFRDYRGRVVAELGEEKDQEFRYSTEEHTIIEQKKNGEVKKTQVKRVGAAGASMYARFFDETCSSYDTNREYNRLFLLNQQRYANDMLQARGHLFLNEVYDALGFPRSEAGQIVGWVRDNGDSFVDFGIFTRGGDYKVRDFVNGHENAILLDFNVDGPVHKLIEKRS